MTIDVEEMFEQLASLGTAPPEGCHLFGAGYERAFEMLDQTYLQGRMSRGGSAEKFVVGPYGSGKTHFLRQLMELGRERGCVTAEVQLNKNLDFTRGYIVYQEIARELRVPSGPGKGFAALLQDAIQRVSQKSTAAGVPAADVLRGWADGLGTQSFASLAFGRVLKRAVHAHVDGDAETFELAARWLAGEVSDTRTARGVGEAVMKTGELNIHAQHARISVFQFVRHVGYRGTIVAFDEAEQGFAAPRRQMQTIFSHLLSEINALASAQQASAFVLHAITPDMLEKLIEATPMLAQRIADPSPTQGFFDGNPLAVTIDLRKRGDPTDDLRRIGRKLLDAFLTSVSSLPAEQQRALAVEIDRMAGDVAADEQSSSARRLMVKRVCTLILQIHGARRSAAVTESHDEV